MSQPSQTSKKSDSVPPLHRNRVIAVGFAAGFGITVVVASAMVLLARIVDREASGPVATDAVPPDALSPDAVPPDTTASSLNSDQAAVVPQGPLKATRTADFVPLPQELTVDLYPDPPTPKNPSLEESEFLDQVGSLVNPQRVQLVNPIGREVLLLPFFKIDMGRLAGRWRWTLKSNQPANFVARPRGGSPSEFVSVTVEPNLYADIQSNNEAIRLGKIAEFSKSKNNLVKATEVQQIDEQGTRFQFFVSLDHSSANLYYLIYDERRVITIHLYAHIRSQLDEVHRIMSNAELLEFPKPGNVPADVKRQIEAVVAQAKALMEGKEYEKVMRLLLSDEVIARSDKRPEVWDGVTKRFPDHEMPLLLKTFSLMDFSEATYQPLVDHVSFPYKQSDILWIKNGDRWTLK